MDKDQIKKWLPGVNESDLNFIVSKFEDMYIEVDDPCVDNDRVSKIDTSGNVSSDYDEALRHGCCGFEDWIIENPETGNKFSIGCNYGH